MKSEVSITTPRPSHCQMCDQLRVGCAAADECAGVGGLTGISIIAIWFLSIEAWIGSLIQNEEIVLGAISARAATEARKRTVRGTRADKAFSFSGMFCQA